MIKLLYRRKTLTNQKQTSTAIYLQIRRNFTLIQFFIKPAFIFNEFQWLNIHHHLQCNQLVTSSNWCFISNDYLKWMKIITHFATLTWKYRFCFTDFQTPTIIITTQYLFHLIKFFSEFQGKSLFQKRRQCIPRKAINYLKIFNKILISRKESGALQEKQCYILTSSIKSWSHEK